MIKGAPFFGYGPESFAFVFPQYDYIGKYPIWRTKDVIVDKPHSWYIHLMLNTGMISFFLVIVFFVYIGVFIRKNWLKGKTSYWRNIVTLLMTGIVGYAVSVLSNDSSLVVSPIFWIFLGLLGNSVLKMQEDPDDVVLVKKT